MGYTSVFINAIVVALMAIYVYQNERRMEELATKHNQTVNSMIYVLGQNTLALERMESNFNQTTTILKRHDGILQEIMKAVQRDNCTTNLKEVAHNKPSEQSSVYSAGHSASKAVDGNVNTFIHTKYDQSPYWIVDLGKNYQIKQIDIFNRNIGDKATGERLRDLDIMIGPSHNEMHLCAHYNGPAQLGDHLLFTCGLVGNARYVKLVLTGTNYLHVAEVKVYAMNDCSTLNEIKEIQGT